jgi:uncharacterized membrane protein
MTAQQLNVRSATRPFATALPRRAVLRGAVAGLATLGVSLAPGLAQDQAAAVSPYRGNLNFVNQTNTTLWIAISYRDEAHCGPDEWVAKGWWELAPGEIKGVHQLYEGHNRYFYYYAYGEDGTTYFSGSTTTYVDNLAEFFWCERDVRLHPDVDTVEMRDLEIDSQTTTYTLRLGTDRYVYLEDGSSGSVPFEPADQPELDADGCYISGGVRLCPAYE